MPTHQPLASSNESLVTAALARLDETQVGNWLTDWLTQGSRESTANTALDPDLNRSWAVSGRATQAAIR